MAADIIASLVFTHVREAIALNEDAFARNQKSGRPLARDGGGNGARNSEKWRR